MASRVDQLAADLPSASGLEACTRVLKAQGERPRARAGWAAAWLPEGPCRVVHALRLQSNLLGCLDWHVLGESRSRARITTVLGILYDILGGVYYISLLLIHKNLNPTRPIALLGSGKITLRYVTGKWDVSCGIGSNSMCWRVITRSRTDTIWNPKTKRLDTWLDS